MGAISTDLFVDVTFARTLALSSIPAQAMTVGHLEKTAKSEKVLGLAI